MLAVSLRNTVAASISVSLDLCQALVMSTKRKYYAVVAGRKPGIYDDWDECKEQVNGFKGTKYQGFSSQEEAEEFMRVENSKKQRTMKVEVKAKSKQLKQSVLRMPVVSTKTKASKASLESKPINLGLRISSSVLDIAPADYEKCVEPCETEPDSDQETEVTPPTKSPTDLTAGLVSVSDASVLFIPSLAVKYQLEYDGASKGNPGAAGAGALLRHPDGTVVAEISVGLGKATNNVAEYRGLIAGMRRAVELGIQRIQAQGDSKLVTEQLEGKWKINNENLRVLCEEAKHLRKKFKEFKIRHVDREFNSAADALANKGVGCPEEKFESPFPVVKKMMKILVAKAA